MKAFRFYFINILLGIIIVAIVAFLGISIFCNVHKVTVEGNHVYTADEIKSYVLQDKYSKNAVYAVVKNKIKPRKNPPFVEKIDVKLTRFDRIKITVTEKHCVGYLPLPEEQYAYFDEEGYVVEISDRVIDNCIGVSGLTLENAQLGEKVALKKNQLEFMVQLLKALQKNELEISALSFDESGNATAVYNTLLISVGKVDYLEEKMMRLPYILPQVEGQAGTLHLENWSEENTDIVFEKAK